MEHAYDIVCVEVGAHGDVLEVEIAGLVLPLHSTTGYQIGDRKFAGLYWCLGLRGFLGREVEAKITAIVDSVAGRKVHIAYGLIALKIDSEQIIKTVQV